MVIETVTVTYGELRSRGYPDFSNNRHEVTLGARIEPSETAEEAKDKLFAYAKSAVKAKFGDANAAQTEMTLPMKGGL